MEKKNNSGILVGILIMIIIILFAFAELLEMGSIGFKASKINDNRQTSKKNQINTREETNEISDSKTQASEKNQIDTREETNEISDSKTQASEKNQIDTREETKEVNNLNIGNNNTGEYIYSIKSDKMGIPYVASIDLTEDGTFYASHSSTMKRWYYGTYEINGNVLKLNYKFTTPAVQNMGEKLAKTLTYTIENGTISGTRNDDDLFASGVDAILKKNSNQYNVKNDFMGSLIDMYTMGNSN